MGPLALLAILSGLMLTTFLESGSEDTPEEPQAPDTSETPDTVETPDIVDEPETPDTPEGEGDTGATFSQTSTSVTIEIGEDETGSIAVIHYVDTEDREDPDEFVQVDEARFYLVPEDVDWSEATYESRSEVPGATEYDESEYSEYNYLLSDFEEYHGLELLGVADFKANPDALSDGITANTPVIGYSLEANTDGDELVVFLPDDAPETRNGVEEIQVTTDTTGTQGTEWLSSATDGVTLDGAGGDDFLDASGADATLIGGAGDDQLNGISNGITADGGVGDDTISLASGSALGGAGDDHIRVVEGTADGGDGNDDIDTRRGTANGGDGNDTVTGLFEGTGYGGDGDDTLYTQGDSTATIYGQAGNDFVGVSGDATGYGGAGDDRLQIDAGGTGFGGTGNDTISIDVRANETETAVLSGGDGADEYTFTLGHPFSDTDTEYLRITDFDPDEDSLVLDAGYAARVGDVSIQEAADGSHSDIIVEYFRTSGNVGSGVTTAVIRLDGAPDITLDQIVIAS